MRANSELTAKQRRNLLEIVGGGRCCWQDHSAKGATAARPGVSNDFFNMIYAVLLGEERGPRLGSFIALYGLDETRKLIDKALAGGLVRESQNALSSR